MRSPRTVVLALITLAAAFSQAPGGIIRVPSEVGRLDEALALAAPYDTVLVAPGTHPSNVTWPSTPGIKLLSEAGAEATVLDGGDDVQVIGIYTGVDTTTVVRGFTITNGHAEGY